MFNASDEMLTFGISGLRILATGFILSAFSVVMCGVFESLGHGKYSLVISLLRQFIIIVPGAMLILPILGLTGVWLMFPLSEFIAAVVALIFYKHIYTNIQV